MSYCRFMESDAYIFKNLKGEFECCACALMSLEAYNSFYASTEEEMLEHIAEHRAAEHDIPEFVDEKLKREIAEREDDPQ